MKKSLLWTLLILSFAACSPQNKFDYQLGSVGAFSEMVAADVKQIGLSSPMSTEEMDEFLPLAKEVAEKNGAKVYREPNMIVTDLFPASVTEKKEVLVIYKGQTLEAYNELKEDRKQLKESNSYDFDSRLDISRRFGRLLSYSPKKINQLLASNTSFRTMTDFGVKAGNVFLYYDDLARATSFYEDIVGLELLTIYDNASIFRVAETAYLILVDAAKGMHSTDEPKSVALAFLSDDLKTWYQYLQDNDVEIKYTLKERDGSAHDGFVAVDPEGYLLEFERFNQHPENEQFMPVLTTAPEIPTKSAPPIKAMITWVYHKDLLSMEGFYQNTLGMEMVADQGWTKIYQLTNSSFIGLVDEKRGMNNWYQDKAVTVSFILDDMDGWFEYVKANNSFELRSDEIGEGPGKRYRAFVGYGPEGYFLEFDKFYEHSDNVKLMEYLK